MALTLKFRQVWRRLCKVQLPPISRVKAITARGCDRYAYMARQYRQFIPMNKQININNQNGRSIERLTAAVSTCDPPMAAAIVLSGRSRICSGASNPFDKFCYPRVLWYSPTIEPVQQYRILGVQEPGKRLPLIRVEVIVVGFQKTL